MFYEILLGVGFGHRLLELETFASGFGGVSIQIYRESSGWKMRQIHPWNLGLDAVAKTYNFANETSSSGVLERIGVYSTKDSPFGLPMQ